MHKITLCVLFLLAAFTTRAAMPTDLTRIKQHFSEALIPSDADPYRLMSVLTSIAPEQEMSDQSVVELHQRYPLDVKKLKGYLSSLSDEGKWPDINYQDQKRSGWEPKNHPERILELVKLYLSTQTPYYHSAEVETAIHKALHYWFSAKLTCPNWWYNQIGVPKTLGNAFILFEEKLTPEEKQQAIAAMKAAKFGMTGQNKVWLAGNVLMRALLQGDAELAKQARDTIVSEIVTGGSEGIKEDWCFHQHGTQQQFGNYGLAFVSSMAFYSRIFADTQLAFSAEQLNIVRQLMTEGYRWVLWNGKMDICSLGRQLFHNAPVHKALCLAFSAAELGGGKSEACNAAARAIIDENFSEPPTNTLTGHKHFWLSDYTIHRTNKWMASIKMASNRVTGVECMNGDNMKGYFMADGTTYIYSSGNEYLNIFPLWNWRKVPGVTTFLADDEPMPQLSKGFSPGNESDFVGGVSDGRQGMTAMEINRAGIHAHKAWVMTDDFVLCLGADIQADSNRMVSTSVEQCFRQGDLKKLQGKTWTTVNGQHTFTGKEHRFFHNGTGYILWNANYGCMAETTHRHGQWHDIMQMYTPQDVEGDVISIDYPQGIAPKNGTYQYLILPSSTEEETKNFKLSSLRILQNDKDAQVVYEKKKGMWWATVYRPTTLNLGSRRTLEILTPGIYQIQQSGEQYLLHASDPTQQADALHLRFSGKDIIIPVAGVKGKSVSVTL